MPLLDYQRGHYAQLLRALVKNGSALDASDTGTGKTFVALEIAKAMEAVPFVVGPKSARGSWEDAAKNVGQGIQFVGYEKLRGARRGDDLARTEWLVEQPWGKGSLLRWKQDFYLVIFDEVHRCGGETSLNSKALIAAKRQAEYILCLSATAADDPRQMKALGYTLGLHGLSKREPIPYVNWLLKHGCTPGVFGGFDFTRDMEKQDRVFRKLNTELFPGRGARMRKCEIPGFPQTQIDAKLFTADQVAVKWASELHGFNQRPESLEEAVECRQRLELLKVPFFIDLAEDYSRNSKVVIFVNFTETRLRIVEELQAKKYSVGQIYGDQDDDERHSTAKQFQANELDILVAMSQAASESWSAHDPTGHVERTVLISPGDSGRQAKQLIGRANRQGGAYSQQFLCYFQGTYEEAVADRQRQKSFNIDLLNDGDFVV